MVWVCGRALGDFALVVVQRYPAHKKQRPPQDPPVGLCLGPMVVQWGGAVSYERGIPVQGGLGLGSIHRGSAVLRRFGFRVASITKGVLWEYPMPVLGANYSVVWAFIADS